MFYYVGNTKSLKENYTVSNSAGMKLYNDDGTERAPSVEEEKPLMQRPIYNGSAILIANIVHVLLVILIAILAWKAYKKYYSNSPKSENSEVVSAKFQMSGSNNSDTSTDLAFRFY